MVVSMVTLILTAWPLSHFSGSCPAAETLVDPSGECLADYLGGCEFDSECVGPIRKCCETSCGYKECVEQRVRPQPPPPAGNGNNPAGSKSVSSCLFSKPLFVWAALKHRHAAAACRGTCLSHWCKCSAFADGASWLTECTWHHVNEEKDENIQYRCHWLNGSMNFNHPFSDLHFSLYDIYCPWKTLHLLLTQVAVSSSSKMLRRYLRGSSLTLRYPPQNRQEVRFCNTL